MILKIEQKHIDKGCQFRPWECPVALAFLEENPGCRVSVGPWTMEVFESSGSENYVQFEFPKILRDWIEKFDFHGIAEPITVEIHKVYDSRLEVGGGKP
jgi:hypothetical protein